MEGGGNGRKLSGASCEKLHHRVRGGVEEAGLYPFMDAQYTLQRCVGQTARSGEDGGARMGVVFRRKFGVGGARLSVCAVVCWRDVGFFVVCCEQHLCCSVLTKGLLVPPTRCVVPASVMPLRSAYALSGTNVVYVATRDILEDGRPPLPRMEVRFSLWSSASGAVRYWHTACC